VTAEVLRAQGIEKRYRIPDGGEFTVACESLTLSRGELVVLMGRSGSGKSTLIQIFGLLMAPDAGTLTILGQPLSRPTGAQSSEFRGRHLGMMFQAFNLLPQLTAEQNVALAFRGKYREARRKALENLETVGLGARTGNWPGELSGGEQQRVAFARATINDPDLLLADEPTGNLDAENEVLMMKLFRDWTAAGRAVLIVSHSEEVAEGADRVLHVSDGHVVMEAR
jgi:ABC-type lipoprotein export system ATPase subunit